MSENVILCFSGSGNCLDIAKNIADGLGDTDIIMMRKAPAITDLKEAKTVGFVTPCHAGGLPLGVEESIKSIQIAPDTYTYGVVSYSGYPGIGLSVCDEIVTRHNGTMDISNAEGGGCRVEVVLPLKSSV